jgi:predicted PurR-regulated permease PerM
MDFTRKAAIAAGISVLFVALALAAWELAHIILLLFAGILFAVFLRSVASALSKATGIPIYWCLIIVVVVGALLTAVAIWWAGPKVAEQVDALSKEVPVLIKQLRLTLGKYSWGQFLLMQMGDLEFGGDSRALFTDVKDFISGIAIGITGIFVILFTGFYMALYPQSYIRGALYLVPDRRHKDARQFFDTVYVQLQRWLVGRVISMTAVAILTGIALAVLGVPMLFLLALLAGLFDFIPNIGPFIAAVPAVLVALTISPQLALYVIAVYAIVQLIENYLLSPIIERRAVKLPPAFVIVVQLMMGVLFGLIGLFVATPIAVVIVVFVRMFRGGSAPPRGSRASRGG